VHKPLANPRSFPASKTREPVPPYWINITNHFLLRSLLLPSLPILRTVKHLLEDAQRSGATLLPSSYLSLFFASFGRREGNRTAAIIASNTTFVVVFADNVITLRIGG
jgi:hypothetical protein